MERNNVMIIHHHLNVLRLTFGRFSLGNLQHGIRTVKLLNSQPKFFHLSFNLNP